MTENYVLVAIENEVIVGVGAIRKSGEIMLNYVSPDARFRGVSKALMMHLEEWALDQLRLAVKVPLHLPSDLENEPEPALPRKVP